MKAFGYLLAAMTVFSTLSCNSAVKPADKDGHDLWLGDISTSCVKSDVNDGSRAGIELQEVISLGLLKNGGLTSASCNLLSGDKADAALGQEGFRIILG